MSDEVPPEGGGPGGPAPGIEQLITTLTVDDGEEELGGRGGGMMITTTATSTVIRTGGVEVVLKASTTIGVGGGVGGGSVVVRGGKSQVGMEFPSGSESKSGLTDLPHLPEEVWVKILDNLNSLDDLRSAINSNVDWKRILQPNKGHFWLFAQIFPFLTKYLERNEVLNCRAVCSQWRQGVDEFIENAEHLAPYNGAHPWDRDLKRVPVWRQTDDNFNCRNPVVDFEAMALLDPGQAVDLQQPFVGREWTLKPEPPYGPELLFQFIDWILPAYGQQLYYLNLDFQALHFNCYDICHLSQDILKNVPNLRQLRIAGDGPGVNIYLLHRMSSLPSVTLPKLRTLQLEFDPSYINPLPLQSYLADTAIPIADILIRNHSSGLGRLEVGRWNSSWESLQWPHLTELHLPVPADIFMDEGQTVLLSLAKLVAPNLGKLCLEFQGNHGSYPADILEVLQSFPKLQHLGMSFPSLKKGASDFDPDGSVVSADSDDDSGYVISPGMDAEIFWYDFEKKLKGKDSRFPLITTLSLKLGIVKLPSFKLLSHFPNLRRINFNYPKGYKPLPLDIGGGDQDQDSESRLDKLADVLLETLCLHNCFPSRSEEEQAIFSEFCMLLSHPRLELVTLEGRTFPRQEAEEYVRQHPMRLVAFNYPRVFEIVDQLFFPAAITEIELVFRRDQETPSKDLNLLELLNNFPNLKVLATDFLDFPRLDKVLANPLLHNSPIMIPSCVRLVTSQLPIPKGFVKHFPNLRLLSVGTLEEPQPNDGQGQRVFCKEWQDPLLYDKYEPGTNQLQPVRTHRLKRIYESDIWNLLPKMVCIRFGQHQTPVAEYDRAGREDFIESRLKTMGME